jgi:hypothetical protein
MDSSRVIIVAKECHQDHQGHHFIKLQSHLLFLRPPCTHGISLLVHELVSPSSIVSTFYPAQKPSSPTPPMPFLPPVTLPSSPSPQAPGPLVQRIVAGLGLGAFYPSFTIYSSKFLSLPCFHAFPSDCPGSVPGMLPSTRIPRETHLIP